MFDPASPPHGIKEWLTFEVAPTSTLLTLGYVPCHIQKASSPSRA